MIVQNMIAKTGHQPTHPHSHIGIIRQGGGQRSHQL
jgi:hypothetical protein